MSPTLLEPLTVPASGVEDESADRKVIARCGGVEWSSADLLLFYFLESLHQRPEWKEVSTITERESNWMSISTRGDNERKTRLDKSDADIHGCRKRCRKQGATWSAKANGEMFIDTRARDQIKVPIDKTKRATIFIGILYPTSSKQSFVY